MNCPEMVGDLTFWVRQLSLIDFYWITCLFKWATPILILSYAEKTVEMNLVD